MPWTEGCMPPESLSKRQVLTSRLIPRGAQEHSETMSILKKMMFIRKMKGMFL